MQNMLERLRNKRGLDERGFTLVELLVVIVILGILAAIVVFSVAGVTDRGVTSACRTDVKAVDAAAEAYYASKGAPAADIGALVGAGFLHGDANFTNASGLKQVLINGGASASNSNGYTITFTPGTAGSGTTPGSAGSTAGTTGNSVAC